MKIIPSCSVTACHGDETALAQVIDRYAESWAEQDPKAALAGIEALEEESFDWMATVGTAIGQ